MSAPRVDFYISDAAAGDARLQLVCRLVDKAYAAGQPTLVLGDDHAELLALDELLWTSPEGSFIPHELLPDATGHSREGPAQEAPVLIGSDPPADFPRVLLINLSTDVPATAAGFERVIEVPAADPASRQQARERFRTYRRLGASPTTHRLGAQPAAGRPL